MIALLGFPLDDVWHRIFGQDVTLWSPTHIQMVGGASLSTLCLWVLTIEGRRSVLVRRPPAGVFALISDMERYCEFFHGMTRWEPLSRKRRGKGARYRVLLQVGSIEAGGAVTVTEWVEGRAIAWASQTGVDTTGRWTLEPAGEATRLRLELQGKTGRLPEGGPSSPNPSAAWSLAVTIGRK